MWKNDQKIKIKILFVCFFLRSYLFFIFFEIFNIDGTTGLFPLGNPGGTAYRILGTIGSNLSSRVPQIDFPSLLVKKKSISYLSSRKQDTWHGRARKLQVE